MSAASNDRRSDEGQSIGVHFEEISADQHGQRLDNYLIHRLKGVPKSRIYRIVRKGEVRVNKGRVKPEYKLQSGDVIRIPPIRVAQDTQEIANLPAWVHTALQQALYEDEHIIAVNKPSGLAAHGGSGMAFGVIEAMRFLYPDWPYLELAHRLDRQTSGCLLLAKSRTALNHLHAQFRRESEHKLEKIYLAILGGAPLDRVQSVAAKISQIRDDSGIKKAKIDAQGQAAKSVFMPIHSDDEHSYVRIALQTGRMHQARVHAAYLGRPIVGDALYGNWSHNKGVLRQGIKRCMLHAQAYQFIHPASQAVMKITAPVPADFSQALAALFGEQLVAELG